MIKLLLILILILPFSVMGANTNLFDRVLIRNDFQFTGGAFALNKVLTSSASGVYTPQSILVIEPTLVTNVSSASLTVTGQGTHTLNIESSFIDSSSLSNITTAGATITITGQGTKVINLETSAARTNANNFFTIASTNTFNAPTFTSNLFIRGGMVVDVKTKTVNYTNTINDYYIEWRPAVGQPTNFLASGSANGQMYIIKDIQLSALATNIVIKPLGTDTIDGQPSYKINGNGNSVTIIYNGTNWGIN